MGIESCVRDLAGFLTGTKEFGEFYALRKQVMRSGMYGDMLEECERTQDMEMLERLRRVPELSAYFASEHAFWLVIGNAMQLLHEQIYEVICE